MPAMIMMQLGVMVVMREAQGLDRNEGKNLCEKVSFVVTPIAACNENRLGRHDERQSNFLKHRAKTNDQHCKRMNYYCY